MCFDAVVVFVTTFLLLFRLTLAHTLKDQLPFAKMSLKGQVKEENLIKELDIDVSQAPCYLDSLFFIHLSIIKCNTMNGMSKDHKKEQESHLQVFIYLLNTTFQK